MKKRKSFCLIFILFLGMINVYGQAVKINGRVYDEADQPVIGATVRLKNDPSRGVATDVDGKFILEVKPGEILVISYVGYKSRELPARDGMTVKLQPDSEVLKDVVIIGYMQRKVANTSASVVKIGSEELTAKPVANPLDAVQGKVTGLQVYSSSGEPSAQLSIALHGQGSLGAGTGPLFILDGMPVGSATIRAMNPNDIESISFLKDAAATSIYGARAANGVIYVMTKRGTVNERARITVRGQYGVSTLANTDYFEQLMTASELQRYYIETGIYTQQELDVLNEKYFKGTDFKWYQYIYQQAPMYEADASISGGTGKTSYYLSAGGLSQEGLRMGSSYKKIFARINLNTRLSDMVRIGLNTSLSYDDAKTSPFGNNNASGGGLAAMNPPFISPFDPETGDELEYVPLLDITTPKHVMNTQSKGSDSFILSTNGNLTVTPVRNLVIRSMAGLELSYGSSFGRIYPSYRHAYGNGSASRSYAKAYNLSTTNTLSYTLEPFDDHHVTAVFGQEYISYKDDGFSAGGTGLLDDRLTLLSGVTKDQSVGEHTTEYAFLSFFGQVSYDYSERYFTDLVLRNDASSRFGSNKRNGLFYSVGLLWKIKKEGFLKNIDWLDEFDFKVSYGTQGNSSIPPYMTASYVGKVGQKKGKMSMGLMAYGNPDLGWERQSKFTAGFKGRFWNTLEFNVEYYNRITSDMLFEVPISHTSGLAIGQLGFVTHLENIGRYMNHGVDIRLAANIVRKQDYGISAYVNFSYNRDKVLELFDGRDTWFEPGSQLGYIVGKPITFVVPIYKGINSQTGHPEWYVPGKDISVTAKDDGKVVDEWSNTLEQNTEVAVYTPVTGGWGVEGRWKGFYLTADFAFALDKHMLSLDKQYYENDYYIRDKKQNFNGSRKLFDYWKEPGDVAEFPSLDYVRSQGKVHQSTYLDTKLLENASFMRLKNLTVGYRLPQEMLKKQSFLTSAKIYFAGRNLVTFTKFRGIDPEVNQNAAFGVNPNTKQVSVGIEIGF